MKTLLLLQLFHSLLRKVTAQDGPADVFISPVFSPPGNWDDFHVPQWPVGTQQEISWKVDEEAFYTFIIYLHRIANDVEPNVHDEINEGPIYGKPLLHLPLARTTLTLEQPGN
jgi:hypothetical protein